MQFNPLHVEHFPILDGLDGGSKIFAAAADQNPVMIDVVVLQNKVPCRADIQI